MRPTAKQAVAGLREQVRELDREADRLKVARRRQLADARRRRGDR